MLFRMEKKISQYVDESDGLNDDDSTYVKNIFKDYPELLPEDKRYISKFYNNKYHHWSEKDIKAICDHINNSRKMKVRKETSEFLGTQGRELGDLIHCKIVRYEGAKKGQFGNIHEIAIINKDEKDPLEMKKRVKLFPKEFNEFIDLYGDETDEWEDQEVVFKVVEYTGKDGKTGLKLALQDE